MNNLTIAINTAIKLAVEEYTGIISKNYEIDVNELSTIWNNSTDKSVNIFTVNKPKTFDVKTLLDKKKLVKENIEEEKEEKVETKKLVLTTKKAPSISSLSSDNGGCQHVMLRGARSGETCGSKPVKDSNFCSKHKKADEPETKTISSKSPGKKLENLPASAIVATKNIRINRFWHDKTGLVFKSASEQMIIGKCIDSKIYKLSKNDMELCEKMNLKYDLAETSKFKIQPSEDSEPETDNVEMVQDDLECKVENKLENKTDNKSENKSENNLEIKETEKAMSAVKKITSVPSFLKQKIESKITTTNKITDITDKISQEKEEKEEKTDIEEEKPTTKPILSKLSALKNMAAKSTTAKTIASKISTIKTNTIKPSSPTKDIKKFIGKIRNGSDCEESGPEDIEEEEELLEEEDD